MPQLFNPQTFSSEQAAMLKNEPGKSLAETNTPEQLRAAGSLQGTMTTPQPQTPISQTQMTQQFQSTINLSLFGRAMDEMRMKLGQNQDLVDQKNKLFTLLYDRQLTPEEKITLTPSQQRAVEEGNIGLIQGQLRMVNDTLKGRTQSIDKSVEYLTSLYSQDLERAEKQRQDSLDTILDYSKTLGISPSDVARNLGYGDEVANQLEGLPAPVKEGVGGGFTPAQINSTINSIAGAFDNEPIVKNYNTAQEGYQTLQSVGVNTKSPADDIAFIYAFAKIMDPNSVVREGEYNTIQKYAQTWADNFGFTAKRVFSNTNFLSSDAKQKMLNALTPKVNTLTSQYQNLRNEYQRQIDDARQGKHREITEYTPPSFQEETSGNGYEDYLNSLTK